MSHARTTIRDSIITAVTGLKTTGVNIFSPEKVSYADADLPALTIYSAADFNDDSDGSGSSAGIIHRDLTVIIEGRTKMSGDVDATLDTIDAEVETALHAVTAYPIDYVSSEKDYDSGLEKPVRLITMTYSVEYMTRAGSPNTIIS